MNKKIILWSMMVLLMIVTSKNLWCTTTVNEISIKMLSKNRKTIPIYFQNGDFWNTNVRLPDLVLKNNSNKVVVIKELRVIGKSKGEELVAFRIDKKQIDQVITETNKMLNRLTRQPMNKWRTYNLHTLFGKISNSSKPFQEINTIKPQGYVNLRLSNLMHFHYIGSNKVDTLFCEFKIDMGGIIKSYKHQIVITPYICKGDYIFPVRGMVTVLATPWNLELGHRMVVSQEFAFDVVDYQRLKSGKLSLSSPPGSNKVSDYFAFHREVHAIGDGIIVASGNKWPDKWVENPKKYSIKRITNLTVKLIKKGIDFKHAILGNYVIIDHQNGEFSLYAHLSEGTVTVRPGDQVKKGQVIGKIGNTSNSTDPHLHFQLMDSKNFPWANGLPIIFKDFKLPSDPIQDFKNSNSLLYGDYIFIHMPEIK